jgi:predicted nucleotidyltransferase
MKDKDFEILKEKIVEALRPLNPNKIILFGSYAYGKPREDSDIDLYIVTNDDYIPKSWKEKMQIKLKFAKLLRNIKQYYDIDLIVHTKKMHEKFKQIDTLFAKEILNKGQVIYEYKQIASD